MTNPITIKLIAFEDNPCDETTDYLKCYPKLWERFKMNTPVFVKNTVELYHWFQDDQFTIESTINKDKREIIFEITGVRNLEDCDEIADWYELINYELVDMETHEQCDVWVIFEDDGATLSVIKLRLCI